MAFLLSLWSGVTGAAPQTAAIPSDASLAAEKATFESLCSDCHEAKLIAGALRTPLEWDDVLNTMQSYGAAGSPGQFAQVRRFVLRAYGKANVNKAPAGDLAPVLDISAELAESVVAFREKNGTFTSLDDLKHVPGMEAAQVDARKTRVVF